MLTEQNQDRFRILFEHSSDAHLIIDQSGIVDCNHATVQLLKCASKEEVMTIHPSELSPKFQPDGRLSLEKALEMDELARKNGVHRFEWVHQKVDGEIFHVNVTLNAVEIGGKPAIIAVWHDLTERKVQEEKLRSEIEAASAIQRSLLPNNSPFIPGVRTAWAYEPCQTLGGDSLNIFRLDEKHIGFYVLDVAGHGAAASLLSVTISHFLSPYSQHSFLRNRASKRTMDPLFSNPGEVMNRLNQQFGSHPEMMQYFTMAYGVLNVQTLDFSVACAGHPSPLFVSGTSSLFLDGKKGVPVGVSVDWSFEEDHMTLKKGDRIIFYSDGVVEAKNLQNEMFGFKNLGRAFAAGRSDALASDVSSLVSAVKTWSQPKSPEDDISVLAFEITR